MAVVELGGDMGDWSALMQGDRWVTTLILSLGDIGYGLHLYKISNVSAAAFENCLGCRLYV